MPDSTIRTELRQRVRSLLDAGCLPKHEKIQLQGGWGNGSTCIVCEQPIRSDQILYGVKQHDDPTERLYQFHRACHAAWVLECSIK